MSYKKMIFTGTLILTLSGFLARILGFYNRIFLSNLIGAKELGIYQLIFPIYMLCFSLCCHGFETGISNLTSRFFAKGQKKNAHHLVRLGCLLFIPAAADKKALKKKALCYQPSFFLPLYSTDVCPF